MPMECYVVVAEYRPTDGSYDVLANFQGPFSTHPVMAKALRVPGPKLRLRIPPDSGGSFGIKLSVFPYIVLASIAARVTGRPVKWVEDRLEHLLAASSGPNRITEIEAAVTRDGRILALRLDQLEDYGAFLRAPMPGPLYRMHGAVTGAYDIANVDVINRVVLTNKMPASLIRGFGGPQLYLALERLVQRIAIELEARPSRRDQAQSRAEGEVSVQGRRRRALRFRRLSARGRDRGRRGASRRPRAPARCRARRRAPLRDRICRRDRARHVQHGLPLDAAHAGGARQGRPEEWRGVDGDGQCRSARRGVGDGRRHGARAGARHRAVADRRRSPRAYSRRHQCRLGDGHGEGSMVDRRRHLFLPLHAGDRGRGASCRGTDGRQAQGHRGQAAQRAAGGRRARRRQNPQPQQSRQRAAVRPRRRHLALVAGHAAGRHGAGPARNRGVVAAGARAAVERRPHQHVADLRLRLRHLRDRDRSADVSGARRPLHLDPRRRPHPQSDDRGGPAARLVRAGHRVGALRGVRLRRQRPVPDRHLRRLSRADRVRNSARGNSAPGNAVAVHAARRQGHGRRQLHEHAGLYRQRHRGCARREGRNAAGDAAAHPRHDGRSRSRSSEGSRRGRQ